jgi:hypothetical protein
MSWSCVGSCPLFPVAEKMALLSIVAYRCKGRPNYMRERSSRSDMASPRRLTAIKQPYPPLTFVSRPLSFYCTRQLTNGLLPHRLARWPRFRAPHSPAAVPPPGLKIATDTAGMLGRSHSHWRKGGLTAVGMRAPGSQWRKCLAVVVFRIGLIAERRARTYFVRHPRNDINLS